MPARDPALQALIDPLLAGLQAGVSAWPGGQGALKRAAEALAEPCAAQALKDAGFPEPPALASALAPALGIAGSAGGYAAAAAVALEALLPQITWYVRQGGETACERFGERHALATLIGPADRPGALEIREDVRVGISLVAPATPYPDHRHPPEELYLALTPGEWRQERGPWFEPGPGGVVFNSPNILHGMRAGSAPQLALWCLPS